jgi:hypothetical protein
MVMARGYLTNININRQRIGPERRQDLLDGIADKGTFLPRGVLEEDMDQAVVEFAKSDKGFSISINGEKVPVIFLTIQRWTEFSKTWQFSDKYKNIELPFITIIRKPDIQQGQNQAGLWNIPGNRTYTYMKVPTWDGIRHGVDLYKVPQPTPVDMTYEMRLFTNRMKDLNKFNRIIQRAFQSRQCYISVNGHPMPLHLESIGDESNIDDFENRRFYVQLFELKLLGYILDEEDFEVVPTLNRTMIATEVDEGIVNVGNIILTPTLNANNVNFTFDFKPESDSEFSFTNQYNVMFTQLNNIIGISRIIILVNNLVVFDGVVMTSPLVFNANDVISIKITKNFYDEGVFTLLGNTI